MRARTAHRTMFFATSTVLTCVALVSEGCSKPTETRTGTATEVVTETSSYQGRPLEAWIERLKSASSKEERRVAVDALIHIGPPAASALGLALDGVSGEERQDITKQLASVKQNWVAEPLAQAVMKEDLVSATEAVLLRYLTEVGPNPNATKFLVRRFSNFDGLPGQERERAKAALALGAMGGEEAILALLLYLTGEFVYQESGQTIDPRTSQLRNLVALRRSLRLPPQMVWNRCDADTTRGRVIG